jgi:hypothetical protein
VPTFDFKWPDGRTYSLAGPEGATPEQAWAVLQQHLRGQRDNESRASASKPSMPEGVVRACATGVPIIGGLANKLDAATNAALTAVVDRFLPDTFE